MMPAEGIGRFLEASLLVPPFTEVLKAVPEFTAARASEIRIRAGRRIAVESVSGRYVCPGKAVSVQEIEACIRHFCDYSLYSCEKELSEGRITLRGGHRAGFTGTAVISGARVTSVRDISSIDLRIAREHKGIAEKLFSLTAFSEDLRGLLLIGPPLSAKTTYLRDYARLLSASVRCAVIDERSEIAAVYGGIPQNDVGENCDVLDRFPKDQGIEHAIRCLSPEYLVLDEVGSEYERLAGCIASGVKLILSAHCADIGQARRNSAVRYLTDSGAVNYIALLCGGGAVGRIGGLWRVNDSKELDGCCRDNDMYGCRSRVLVGA